MPLLIKSVELCDIKPPSIHRKRLFTGLDHDSNGYVEGIKEIDPMKLNFLSSARYSEFSSELWVNESRPFAISFPDGSEWQFDGFVTGVNTSAEVDGLQTMSVNVRPSSAFHIAVKKEERMFPKGLRNMPPKPALGLKGFYVGSNAMPENWTHADLKTAVAHATQLVNDRETGQEEVFVVKIVKVVRRKEAPVTVANFKPYREPKVKKTRG